MIHQKTHQTNPLAPGDPLAPPGRPLDPRGHTDPADIQSLSSYHLPVRLLHRSGFVSLPLFAIMVVALIKIYNLELQI